MSLLNSLWLRQFIAAIRLATVETLPERAEAWPEPDPDPIPEPGAPEAPGHFNNTQSIGGVARPLFYRDKRSGTMLPFKGRAKPVAVEKKVGIEAHITAVAYGTTAKSRKFWRNAIVEGVVPRDVVALFGTGVPLAETPEEARGAYLDQIATRMALHQRFWKVPYHFVGLLNGDVLHNNNIERYTFHGGEANAEYIGVSLEGNFPGLEKNRKAKHTVADALVIETGRATLRLAVIDSRKRGAPIEILKAHRQYSSRRVGDPGQMWWREIGIPVAQELNLERPVTFTAGSGLQVCQEWDPLGQVNYRGKPL